MTKEMKREDDKKLQQVCPSASAGRWEFAGAVRRHVSKPVQMVYTLNKIFLFRRRDKKYFKQDV